MEALFQPSVDAIDAKKGHLKGNLRIVCAFLNPCDNSAYHKPNKTYPVHCWTPELFRQVFRVPQAI